MSGSDTTLMMIAFGASWAIHVLEIVGLLGVAVIVGLRRREALTWIGIPAAMLLVLAIATPLITQGLFSFGARTMDPSSMLTMNGVVTLVGAVLHAGAWVGLLVGLLTVLGRSVPEDHDLMD